MHLVRLATGGELVQRPRVQCSEVAPDGQTGIALEPCGQRLGSLRSKVLGEIKIMRQTNVVAELEDNPLTVTEGTRVPASRHI